MFNDFHDVQPWFQPSHVFLQFSPRFLAQHLSDLGSILQAGTSQNFQEHIEGRQLAVVAVVAATRAAAAALLMGDDPVIQKRDETKDGDI